MTTNRKTRGPIAKKRPQRETLEDLVLRLRATGAHTVSICVGDDSLQVQWPDHEPRDRMPSQGGGIMCQESDGWDGKVGFR